MHWEDCSILGFGEGGLSWIKKILGYGLLTSGWVLSDSIFRISPKQVRYN